MTSSLFEVNINRRRHLFSGEVLIVWTEETIVSVPNNTRIIVEKTRDKKQQYFLAKTSNFELIFGKKQLKLKYNENEIEIKTSLEWNSNSDIFEMNIFGKTIEIVIKEEFIIKWTPIRHYISLKLNLTSNELRVKSVENNLTGNDNDVICRKWFQLPNNEQELCAQSRDVCNFGANLVMRNKITRIPNECLDCDANNHVFGQRKQESRVVLAEILFIIGCDLESHDLKSSLNRLSNALKREFTSRGIRTRFQVMSLSRDRKYSLSWPKFESKLNLNRIHSTQNTTHSLDFFLVTSLPSTASSRHILMITCLNECQLNHIDFITARTLLLNSNIFLHVLTTQSFRVRAKKARHVIGIDADVAFTRTKQYSRELRNHVMVSRDLCHVLSLETNGTVFRLKALKQKNSRAILAKRIAENHWTTSMCLRCDCVLTRDHMTSHSECHLCEERQQTITGGPHIEEQQWDDQTVEEE